MCSGVFNHAFITSLLLSHRTKEFWKLVSKSVSNLREIMAKSKVAPFWLSGPLFAPHCSSIVTTTETDAKTKVFA